MKTYTFSVEGATHDEVVAELRKVAGAYWGRTDYKVVDVRSDGDYFRQLGGARPLSQATVTTVAVEVAS